MDGDAESSPDDEAVNDETSLMPERRSAPADKIEVVKSLVPESSRSATEASDDAATAQADAFDAASLVAASRLVAAAPHAKTVASKGRVRLVFTMHDVHLIRCCVNPEPISDNSRLDHASCSSNAH